MRRTGGGEDSSTTTSTTTTTSATGVRRSGRMATRSAAREDEAKPRRTLPHDQEEEEDHEEQAEEEEEEEEEGEEQEGEAVYCLCRKSHENGFMIACDECDEWYHGKCVNITAAQGRRMAKYVCPVCSDRRRRTSSAGGASADGASTTATANAAGAGEHKAGTTKGDEDEEPLFSDDEREGGRDADGESADSEGRRGGREGTRRSSRRRGSVEERRGRAAKSEGEGRGRGDHNNNQREEHGEEEEDRDGEAFVRAPWYDPETDQVDHEQWEAAMAAAGTDGADPRTRHASRRRSNGDSRSHHQGNGVKRKRAATDDHESDASSERYRGCDAATRGVRELVVSTLADALAIRAGGGKTDAEPATVRTIAESIEAEMWKMFDQQASAQYKAKYRSLLFNLKDERNQELRDSVLSGEMAPAELCKKTSQELAPAELAEWRRQRAEKYFQENVMITADSAVILKKTHKGEEILHAPTSPLAEPSSSSSISPPPVSSTSSTLSPEGALPQAKKARVSPPKARTPPPASDKVQEHPLIADGSSDDKEGEYAEPDIDINLDVSGVLSTEEDPLSALLSNNPVATKPSAPTVPSSSAQSMRVGETSSSPASSLLSSPSPRLASESAPFQSSPRPSTASTSTGPSSEGLIWQGSLIKAGMETSVVVAHHLAGPHTASLQHVLPRELQVQGRVDLSKLAKYIAGLAASRHRIHSLMILEPMDMAASVPYIAMLHYFGTKGRAGVVINLQGTPIKEVYVIPITSDDVHFRDILRLDEDKLLAVVVTDKDFATKVAPP